MRKRMLILWCGATALAAGCGERSAETGGEAADAGGYEAAETASKPATEAPDVMMRLPMSTVSEEARAMFLKALHANDVGRFVDANALFEEAAAADPDFALAYMFAGLTGASTEEFADNLAKARERRDGASESERLIINGWQDAFDGNQEGRVEKARQVTELNGDSPRAWIGYANALTAVGRISDARSALAQALDRAPDFVGGHIAAGNNYLNQMPKDFAKAAMHFETAVSLEPDESTPYDLLGDVHRAQGRLEDAYNDYTRAAELAPTLGSPLQQRGHVNSFLGNYDEARADYTRAMALEDARGSNTAPFFGVFRAYVSLHEGDPDAAIAELRALIDEYEGSGMEGEADLKINALNNIALIATHYGDVATAEEAIDDFAAASEGQAASVGNPEFARAQEANVLFARGMLAARQGDADAVAALAADFTAKVEADANPRKHEPMHMFEGLAAYQAGDCAGAEAHLVQADQNNIYVRYHRAVCFAQVGDDASAQEIFGELAVYNFNGPYYAIVRKDVLARVSETG